jgi:hypothetical protein
MDKLKERFPVPPPIRIPKTYELKQTACISIPHDCHTSQLEFIADLVKKTGCEMVKEVQLKVSQTAEAPVYLYFLFFGDHVASGRFIAEFNMKTMNECVWYLARVDEKLLPSDHVLATAEVYID